MSIRIETLILNVLSKDSEYLKKVTPHLKSDYFQSRPEKIVYELVDEFYTKYNNPPTKDVLSIELSNRVGLTETEYSEAGRIIEDSFTDEYRYDFEWLLDQTEAFCKERSIYNAIMKSMKIINGDEPKLSENSIPGILQDALSVSFDKSVGHDYFEDAQKRYDYYNSDDIKIHCSIDIINKITNKGLPRKILGLLMAPSGAGKSGVMCSLAADYLSQGYNVLYITMELAEEKVAQRIDANLFNVPLAEVAELPEKMFFDKVAKIKDKIKGKLVVKEYPTSTASVSDFRILLDELKAKKGFIPDVIFVDYMGICVSSKYKGNANVNSYTTQKAVSEELRGFAVETNTLLWSAVQTNRSGIGASDYDVDAMSESIGPLMTADILLGIIRTPDLDEMQQIMLKQLKNRFGDLNYFKSFVVGFDFSRMRLFNINTPESSNNNDNRIPTTPTRTPTVAASETGWDFG